MLSPSFFARPAEVVAPDLIGCWLVKKENDEKFLSGVIVETEAYSEIEESCHGHKKRTTRNEGLFGEPGTFYIYLTYGIYHCVNIVTDKVGMASGVLIRALAIPGENERACSGPGLSARRFNLNRSHDKMPISLESGIWLAEKSEEQMVTILRTTRIGITKAKDLTWRWYLQQSRSVSKRAKGDKTPSTQIAWTPLKEIDK